MANLDNFLDQLSLLIEKSLEFEKEMDDILVRNANKAIEEIKVNIPVGKSKEHTRDTFTYLKEGSKELKSVTIYSATKGRLLHLIEYGFNHRGGKYVMARPFLRPAYEKVEPELVNEIKEAIENANKRT